MNKFNYTNLTPFKWFVLENFPFIEADFDALTEWQLFCKIGKEINKIINSTNTLGTQVESLTDYVKNYFDNLDVQEEINNKLNEMAESGELQEIIENYINLKSILCFDTVADLKNSENLVEGSFARTLGYYNINDGGDAIYKIVSEIDENEFQEELESGLYATLIHKPKFINMKSVGCKSDDNTFDNSTIINNIIEKFGRWFTFFFPFGEYYIENPISIMKNYITIKGENERTRVIKTTSNGVDRTIETSKGTTYNLNNYDMCFYVGKETSASDTVSKVKFEDISIQGYDSTDNSHCILLIGCSYFETENVQLLDYNKGILFDDCFACNINDLTALSFGTNRSAIEVIDSTAIYITNCYLNARYYSIFTNNSRVYVDNVACDSHGYVFNATNNSFLSIVNSRCESYSSDINCSNSIIVASECDFEGHSNIFNQFVKATNGKINIKNSVFRFQVYKGSEAPVNVKLFDLSNNSLVNVEAYINIYNNLPTINSNSNSSLYLIDLNSEGLHFDVTPAEGITLSENECYVKDGYVNIYLAGNKSIAFEQNTSTEIGTIANVPLPSVHAHRFNVGTGVHNVYTTYNNAYGGINTSGKLSIQTPEENQRYFVINTRYKIR